MKYAITVVYKYFSYTSVLHIFQVHHRRLQTIKKWYYNAYGPLHRNLLWLQMKCFHVILVWQMEQDTSDIGAVDTVGGWENSVYGTMMLLLTEKTMWDHQDAWCICQDVPFEINSDFPSTWTHLNCLKYSKTIWSSKNYMTFFSSKLLIFNAKNTS